jgi:acyl transferase domain-containing protein
LEEHLVVPAGWAQNAPDLPELFLLSARDSESLERYARSIALFLEKTPPHSLANAAYTSQVGRTAHDARLAIIASSVTELGAKLTEWLAACSTNTGGSSDKGSAELQRVFEGNAREARHAGNLLDGKAGETFLRELLAGRDIDRLAKLWVYGVEIDWHALRRPTDVMRTSFPTYPFARESYWLKSTIVPVARPVPPDMQPDVKATQEPARLDPADDGRDLVEKTRGYLKDLIGLEIQLPPARIDARERLAAYGVDSIMIARFNASLDRDIGALPKTLFYE